MSRIASPISSATTRWSAASSAGLDPLPRLLLLPGFGMIGVGKTAAEASVACDVGGAWMEGVASAERIGGFESMTEAEHFEVEYWSLEQAKLGKTADKILTRRVVLVTGGGGAIGAATAKAFAAAGADARTVLDLDGEKAAVVAKSLGPKALALACDVTDPKSVESAFAAAAAAFGGVDIVVSNAGAAWSGMMADMPDEVLRKSFELNFFAHQAVAQAAVRIMRAQAMGGCLLFNVSKQAINPGANFGSLWRAVESRPARARAPICAGARQGRRCASTPSTPTASAPACSPTP